MFHFRKATGNGYDFAKQTPSQLESFSPVLAAFRNCALRAQLSTSLREKKKQALGDLIMRLLCVRYPNESYKEEKPTNVV